MALALLLIVATVVVCSNLTRAALVYARCCMLVSRGHKLNMVRAPRRLPGNRQGSVRSLGYALELPSAPTQNPVLMVVTRPQFGSAV